MKYEIKRFGSDPFDVMCSDCPVHEIEWWESVTLDDLHTQHEYELAADASLPGWLVQEMRACGEWNPTPLDFGEWLRQNIAEDHVRVAA